MDKNEVKPHHIWIGDTGASCHMTICKDSFTKTRDIHGKTQGAHKSEEVSFNRMKHWKGI